jgi:predicted secreted protein
MPSVPGRTTVVSWSSDGGTTYHPITGIDSFQDGLSASPIADNEFGDQWSQNVPGILDNKISMSGGLRIADTNGQVAIETALKAGTYGYIKVLWDGTNGYSQQVLVTKFQGGSKVADRVVVTIELASQGAPTNLP